jgi:hypothetical protein
VPQAVSKKRPQCWTLDFLENFVFFGKCWIFGYMQKSELHDIQVMTSGPGYG